MHYNFAADSFYIMKLCSRRFVLHCRSRTKYDNSRHFDPHFEEVRGRVEPWKASAEFLLSVIELLFPISYSWGATRQTCQNSQPSGVGRSLWATISGGRGRLWGIFFRFLQNETHFAIQRCKLHRATCRRFDTIPACDGRTDRPTDRQT